MPFHVSSLLKRIPSDLDICQPPATPEELNFFTSTRERYAVDPAKAIAAADKIRAFRLLKGMRRYLEVGTFDKFNLRYVMEMLASDALVIDLDIAENIPARDLLESERPRSQQYHCVVGDSTADETLKSVKEIAGSAPLDAIFIDANHVATYAMTDFALYGELVSRSGYVFFHDVKWEGHERAKGVADALEVLHQYVPIYQVLPGHAVTRWFRPLDRKANNWGGIAIIRGEDFHNA